MMSLAHMQFSRSVFVPDLPLNLTVPAMGTDTSSPVCIVTARRPQPVERVTRPSVIAACAIACSSQAAPAFVSVRFSWASARAIMSNTSSTHSAFLSSARRAPLPIFTPVTALRPPAL